MMNENVEAYFFSKDEKFTKLLFLLRAIIIKSDTIIIETIKYKIPFYVYKSNLCYINIVKDKYVDLGFIDGFKLPNNYNKLIAGNNRKRMKSLRFFSIDDFNEEVVRATLIEAIDFQN